MTGRSFPTGQAGSPLKGEGLYPLEVKPPQAPIKARLCMWQAGPRMTTIYFINRLYLLTDSSDFFHVLSGLYFVIVAA